MATKADLASPTFTGSPVLPTGTTATTQTSTDSSTKLATTAFVQTVLQALYPVGTVYTNATSSTNPATLLGFGTWTAFGAGKVMVGLDSGDATFSTVGNTGGSKDAVNVSHTHTATSTDSGHTHTTTLYTVNDFNGPQNYKGGAYSDDQTGTWSITSSTGNANISTTISTTGSSATNANLPPYVVVYLWKRTA